MVPIPADPLALPFTHKSDPLRGPVFVPLDTECLMGNKSYLFQGMHTSKLLLPTYVGVGVPFWSMHDFPMSVAFLSTSRIS